MKKLLIALIFITLLYGNTLYAETFGNYVSCTMTDCTEGNCLADAETEDDTFTCTAVTNSYCPADLGCTNASPCRLSIRSSSCSTFTGCAAREIPTAKSGLCDTGTWTFTVKARDRESVAECTDSGVPYACCTGSGTGSCNPVHSGDWGEGSKVDMVLTAQQMANQEAKVTMTYPDAGVPVSTGSAWGTSLSTDGSGDCGSGAVCLGDHTHSSYLTAVASDADWTVHGSYPSACTGTQFVQGLGDTLSCAQPSDVTGNAATATTSSGLSCTDCVDDTEIDWGAGANQVDTDDVGEGSVNKFAYIKRYSYTSGQTLTAAVLSSGRVVVDNAGASANMTHNLPECSVTPSTSGVRTMVVTFYIVAGYYIEINPYSTDQILGETNSGGDNLRSTAIENVWITMECYSTGKWFVWGSSDTEDWSDVD